MKRIDVMTANHEVPLVFVIEADVKQSREVCRIDGGIC